MPWAPFLQEQMIFDIKSKFVLIKICQNLCLSTDGQTLMEIFPYISSNYHILFLHVECDVLNGTKRHIISFMELYYIIINQSSALSEKITSKLVIISIRFISLFIMPFKLVHLIYS